MNMRASPVRTTFIGRLLHRSLSTRWLMRLPIGVFRCGLGPILGSRMVMVEHLGRVSGEPRFVILEVLERGPGRIVVASGFGTASQWYRNLRANGVAYLSTGLLRRVRAKPRFMDAYEAQVALNRYRAAHPRGYQLLRRAMESAQGGDPEIPLIEFLPAVHRRVHL